jgi:hypothetical protein
MLKVENDRWKMEKQDDINGYLLRFYRSDIVVAGLVPAKRYLSLRDDINRDEKNDR